MATEKVDYELNLISSTVIAPDSIAQITARPECVAFRGDKLIIKNGERWLIKDIRVGNRSQLETSEPIPGVAFSPVAESDTAFDTCQEGMDISFIVEYIGSNPEGEIFEAKMYGVAIV